MAPAAGTARRGRGGDAAGACCLAVEVWLGPTRGLGNGGCKATPMAWRGLLRGDGLVPVPCLHAARGASPCPEGLSGARRALRL